MHSCFCCCHLSLLSSSFELGIDEPKLQTPENPQNWKIRLTFKIKILTLMTVVIICNYRMLQNIF